MRKYVKKPPHFLLQSLELLGKPLFFSFALLLTFIFFVGLLSTKLLQSVKVPSLPHLPRPSRLFFFVLFLLLSWSLYWYIFRDLPSVKLLTDSQPSLTTKIYDRHGALLYQIYKDENRSLIKLADLPAYVINATLSAEDKNFYHHPGFDPLGISRAAFNNLSCYIKLNSCRLVLQGGSTITQQLVKNVLLTREKSLSRKLKELVLAVEAELVYTKDEILEMYFNQVPYGGTAYGIEQASWQYFGKHAVDLNVAESALLAGLPVSPTTLSPYGVSPYLAVARQHQVLSAMVDNGYLSDTERLAAENSPITLSPQGISIEAPHFVMYVKDLLVKLYGEDLVSRGGLNVTTTLDLSTQAILQKEIVAELKRLENLRVSNGAGLVVDPGTGEILAMVGSKNFFDQEIDGQVNLTLQPRQPGSSIKPITYTLAFTRGLTPATVIDDSPICFRLAGQPDYCPSNYDGKFHGPVTLRTALASSYNIPAIKLLNSLGIVNMITLAKSMGITTWDDPSRFGLSLTLGGGEVTMLDMAQVYSIFARSGQKIPLTPLLAVTNQSGASLLPNAIVPQEIISPGIAYQISSILSDPVARAPAFGINSILNVRGHQVAVKTGTTNNLRDNWTFGYTLNLLVATWVGNNDNTPMSSVASGITGASPIWSRTTQKLLDNLPVVNFEKPAVLVRAKITCATPPLYEYFTPGTEPRLDCSQIGSISETAASTSQ